MLRDTQAGRGVLASASTVDRDPRDGGCRQWRAGRDSDVRLHRCRADVHGSGRRDVRTGRPDFRLTTPASRADRDGSGGSGARVAATLAVTPGQTLFVEVGGVGQCNGAGLSGNGALRAAVVAPRTCAPCRSRAPCAGYRTPRRCSRGSSSRPAVAAGEPPVATSEAPAAGPVRAATPDRRLRLSTAASLWPARNPERGGAAPSWHRRLARARCRAPSTTAASACVGRRGGAASTAAAAEDRASVQFRTVGLRRRRVEPRAERGTLAAAPGPRR